MIKMTKYALWLLVGLLHAGDVAFAKEPIDPIPEITIDNPELWTLGRLLFHDRRLSKDNNIACVSCHHLSSNGADDVALSLGSNNGIALVNTPTVFNARYNFRQFWDGRAATLTDQVSGPIHNPKEMNTDWPSIIKKLSLDKPFMERYQQAFHTAIDQHGLIKAIAFFGASLTTPNAPFDQYLLGQTDAISPEALQGYRLFKEYGCVNCHQGINVGGNMYQKMGIFGNYFDSVARISPQDLGRFNVTKKSEDKFVFKVPSLRNIAKTAPYFHNGQVQTLEEAVRLMGLYQLGIEIDEANIQLIVTFLQTLSGEYLNKTE